MPALAPAADPHAPDAFVALAGRHRWSARLAEIARLVAAGPRAGKAIRQQYAIELALERLRRTRGRLTGATDQQLAALAADAVTLAGQLAPDGRGRFAAALSAALAGHATLAPLFHLLRTAALQRTRGFTVHHAGLEDGAPFDLLLRRGDVEAELACAVVSAEAGRLVHRGAWYRLADRIDPDLQTWLAAHPGRYLLKMTLPHGLRTGASGAGHGQAHDDALATLHRRINSMLQQHRRSEQDAALVLRLDPLLLLAAQADELGLMPRLRREFGPEAHLAVTTAGTGVFVMAARAGQEDDVAAAVRRRMEEVAPARLTGTRPGILAMFIEDTDRDEWRSLRERLELEGETRHFLTRGAARSVVAVTCASRLELFGVGAPDAAPDGELRFRNPGHPAARLAALAPAVLSSN